MNLDIKTTKAIDDLKSALESFSKLNDEQRRLAITVVFGANAINQVNTIYKNYLKNEGR